MATESTGATCSPGISRNRSSRGPGITTPSTGSVTPPQPVTPPTATSRSGGSPLALICASSLNPSASRIVPDQPPDRVGYTHGRVAGAHCFVPAPSQPGVQLVAEPG